MKYNSKMKLLIVLSILLLGLIIVAISLAVFSGEDQVGEVPSEVEMTVTPSAEISENTETMMPTQPPTEEPTEAPTEIPTEIPTAAPTAKPTEAPTEAPAQKPTDAPAKKPNTGNQDANKKPDKPETPTKPQETEPPALSLPHTISGTELVITQINSYDGIFLEDGSDKTVSGINVMVLENRGKKDVEYANITLMQNGKELKYEATLIPAGTTIVVQESSAAGYSSGKYTNCVADVAYLESMEMSSSLVKIEEKDDGSLTVTNLGDSTIPAVRIFYKFALDKGEIYVGGITYNAKITDLEPGVPQSVAPSHYAPGSSEIMMVRTYDTVE